MQSQGMSLKELRMIQSDGTGTEWLAVTVLGNAIKSPSRDASANQSLSFLGAFSALRHAQTFTEQGRVKKGTISGEPRTALVDNLEGSPYHHVQNVLSAAVLLSELFHQEHHSLHHLFHRLSPL